MEKTIYPKIGLQYLYILLMVSFTFQLSSQLPIVRRHYIFWIVGFGFAIYYASKYLLRPVSLASYTYLFFVWVNFFSGDVFFNKMMDCVEETICLIVPITMLYYLFSRNDKRLFWWLLIVFSLFLVESTIVSFWADIVFPGIMRLESNKESAIANEAIIGPFKRIGLSAYSLPHALPIVIPALVYLVKQSEIKGKIPWIIVLTASLVLLYVSGSTTALLLGGFVFLLSIIARLDKKNGSYSSMIIIALLVIPFLVSQDLQIWLIRLLQTYIPEDSLFTQKLVDMEYSFLYGDTEGTVEGRMSLYQVSIDGFFSNPLIGTNEAVGAHASLLDRLSTLGIMGIVPLVIFFFYQVRYTLRYIGEETKIFYLIGLFAGLMMTCVKGVFGWDICFCAFVMLPGILWWSDNRFISKD